MLWVVAVFVLITDLMYRFSYVEGVVLQNLNATNINRSLIQMNESTENHLTDALASKIINRHQAYPDNQNNIKNINDNQDLKEGPTYYFEHEKSKKYLTIPPQRNYQQRGLLLTTLQSKNELKAQRWTILLKDGNVRILPKDHKLLNNEISSMILKNGDFIARFWKLIPRSDERSVSRFLIQSSDRNFCLDYVDKIEAKSCNDASSWIIQSLPVYA